MPVKLSYLYFLLISVFACAPCYGDTTAPRPSSMKWQIVPATLGPTSIQMAAVTALDAGDDYPVQYLFECTNHSEASSTWQADANYTAAGLTPSTVYTFKARARDSAGNQTGWTSACSATTDAVTTPPVLRLDLNNSANNNDENTQTGFSPFTIEDSGSEIDSIAIDLSGNIISARRDGPSGTWIKYDTGGSIPGDPCYYGPRAGERIYRDFAYGVNPSGVTITLWGLGTNRDCNITIWAFDTQYTDNATIANWYANGTHILDTNFTGGSENWPQYDNYPGGAADLYKYAFKGRATSDYLGRIILTSERGTSSPADQPFAFVNAIKVEPNSSQAFIQTKYAYHPVPVDGEGDTPADVILGWEEGVCAETHDVYFGTDEAKVIDANRSNTLGVLVSEGQSATTYDPPGALDLNTTYYWRIDEVNGAPDYTIFKGEVCSFKTLPYFIVDNFNSYADDAVLRNAWNDGSTNSTSAVVAVETTIVRDGNSMKYLYNNNLSPYYSEVYADIADLGIDDPNWLGIIGAQSLVLRFHVELNNPFSEQMYVKLTDGDSPAKTATVMYNDTNNVRLKQWNSWSIPLTEFTDVNLANVERITIGFGDGSPGDANAVYFEDIMIGKEAPGITGEVHIGTVYQELEGLGAAVGWREFLPLWLSQSDRNNLYDVLFSELGLDIYRLRNTYGYDSSYIDNSAQVVAAAKARNPSLKILISAWSPQESLKSNNDIGGGGNATLAKDPNDPNNSAPNYYVYKKYAKWWADSLVDWSNHGIVADYASIQNEPDFDASWDSCRFDLSENTSVAGYPQAFEAVYQEIYSRMGVNIPKMLAPEVLGLYNPGTYIDNLIDRSHVYGFAHHLYAGGGDVGNPDGFIPLMIDFRNNYGDRPLMQTEFSKGDDGDVTTFLDAMNLANAMHNSLVFENVSAYIYWELFEWTPKGLVRFMWQDGFYYIINPIYYAFKHYAYFTEPGWHRVEASTDLGDLGSLRISAFKNPENDQLTIVILNLSAASSIDLELKLKGFAPSSSEVYRSTETANWLYLGSFNPSLTLPAYSITTIHLTGTTSPDCDAILAAGYGLTSDISSDCYVDYEDLKIITDNWLADCAEPENCEGADFEPTDGIVNIFDFAHFTEQWLICNDPEDTGCIENW